MRSLRVVGPGRAVWLVTATQLWLLLAAIVAACLLAGYVQLLNDSVARGPQWRTDQQRATGKPDAKVARVGPNLAQSRNAVVP